MNGITDAMIWYGYIFVLGIFFLPLVSKIFPTFVDRGYAFAKTVAIIILSYAAFLLGIFKIAPFTQSYLYILLIAFGFLNFLILLRDYRSSTFAKETKKQHKPTGHRISFFTYAIFEESIFLAGFLFLTFIRSQEPSIRGLEKFMDFGFMNSILRSHYFPPLDMWLSADPSSPAGYGINYYYFGHLTGAMLIKLTGVLPTIGYNLVLATILGQAASLSVSIVLNLIYTAGLKAQGIIRVVKLGFFALLGMFLVNLAGNLHTIYVFTRGYPNESPVPFWNILLNFEEFQARAGGNFLGLGWLRDTTYWYPNATRFIPFTIHEFPSYSYVVADLHGHVFDIPFVLVTLGLLFSLYQIATGLMKKAPSVISTRRKKEPVSAQLEIENANRIRYLLPGTVFLGFLTAVHYMTNAFDGPIYLLLAFLLFLVLFRISVRFFVFAGVTIVSFILFALPFSFHFEPFVSGIGVNCAPQALTALQKLGPFIFEEGKCQVSPLWMLFVLWGFFFVSAVLLTVAAKISRAYTKTDIFAFVLFGMGFFLIFIPEFFYIKDIYPDHFRANTMFKLGYQAYIMMSLASAYTFYRISSMEHWFRYILKAFYFILFFLLFLYPFYAFPSYYGNLKRAGNLDGQAWMAQQFPEDNEIVNFLNENIEGQPVILEAQGDSYTDYERISAYTGLPTVAGWWVHEWLWRGSADVVGSRIEDISRIYESEDITATKSALEKYQVEYVIVSGQERLKYPALNEAKFSEIGEKIFESRNKQGSVYRVGEKSS